MSIDRPAKNVGVDRPIRQGWLQHPANAGLSTFGRSRCKGRCACTCPSGEVDPKLLSMLSGALLNEEGRPRQRPPLSTTWEAVFGAGKHHRHLSMYTAVSGRPVQLTRDYRLLFWNSNT